MNVLCIGERHWSVLVTEQVLEELSDWGTAKEPKNAMVSLLTKSIPEHGPPHQTPACKALGDRLFEFRKGEHRGAKVRVLWFYGSQDRRTIVCVRAFVKTFSQTPLEEIEAAHEARSSYQTALRERTLVIEDGTDLVRRKK